MGGNHVIGFKSSINAGNFINVFLHLLKIVSTKLDTINGIKCLKILGIFPSAVFFY
ncbi:hypothetical protein PSHI8_19080 [Polynucleobacter sp. SHI8]|nr:hypothetical protein PSHI2_19070 [Polynucleobacter sp. SHI2]BDW14272.1 hypothetical protein PSHI8_19080 [Polynucleobacter sp. SHI8]